MKPRMVECPHCLGDGEEPGAPIELSDDGMALCSLCGGNGEVSAEDDENYWNEMEAE